MIRIILITLLVLLVAAVICFAVMEPVKFIIWAALIVTPILRFNHNAKALR